MSKELIEALGGNKAVAAEFGVAPNVVANWSARVIPWKRRHVIAKMAAERGIPLPQDYWSESK